MSRVYSAQLFRSVGLGGGGPFVLGDPPSGTVWVVRHMTAEYYSSTAGIIKGFSVNFSDLTPVWAIRGGVIMRALTYQWSGRHVVYAGDPLEFSSVDAATPGWNIFASGYSLTVP